MFMPAAQLRLRPSMEDLPSLLGWIESFADTQHLTPADTFALTLAAEELFTNTLQHSKTAVNDIQICLQRDAEDTVRISYRDNGSSFNPLAQPEPDTSLAVEERSIGGLGIHLIRKSMVSFSYERIDAHNCVTLVRRLVASA
jgi:serine/threonine-protein kinase RsbW